MSSKSYKAELHTAIKSSLGCYEARLYKNIVKSKGLYRIKLYGMGWRQRDGDEMKAGASMRDLRNKILALGYTITESNIANASWDKGGTMSPLSIFLYISLTAKGPGRKLARELAATPKQVRRTGVQVMMDKAALTKVTRKAVKKVSQTAKKKLARIDPLLGRNIDVNNGLPKELGAHNLRVLDVLLTKWLDSTPSTLMVIDIDWPVSKATGRRVKSGDVCFRGIDAHGESHRFEGSQVIKRVGLNRETAAYLNMLEGQH